MMKDLSNSRRQEFIFQLIKGRDEEDALSVAEIHKLLEDNDIFVNKRTVRRDMQTLSRSKGICSVEGGSPERFFCSKDFKFEYNLQLNENTLQVLTIALNNLKSTSHHLKNG